MEHCILRNILNLRTIKKKEFFIKSLVEQGCPLSKCKIVENPLSKSLNSCTAEIVTMHSEIVKYTI